MTDKLTDTEKAQLSKILRTPVLTKAIAITEKHRRRGCNRIDEAALNQAYNEGHDSRIDQLYDLCGAERPREVQPARLRKTR